MKKQHTFEKLLNRLTEIVDTLEGNTVSLDESLALYKEGLAISMECNAVLTKYESEILVLQKESSGVFITTSFDSV